MSKIFLHKLRVHYLILFFEYFFGLSIFLSMFKKLHNLHWRNKFYLHKIYNLDNQIIVKVTFLNIDNNINLPR